MRPKSASSQRAKAEAAHRKVMARREAESTVRASYFRFAGNSDVASFMRWLGYDTPASKDASLPALFHAAVQVRNQVTRDFSSPGVLLKDLMYSSTYHASSTVAYVAKRLLCWMSWQFLREHAEAGTQCAGLIYSQWYWRHSSMLNVIHTQDKAAHQGECGVQVAQSSRRESMSQDKQMLAEATITKLQEWLSQLQKDAPAEP